MPNGDPSETITVSTPRDRTFNVGRADLAQDYRIALRNAAAEAGRLAAGISTDDEAARNELRVRLADSLARIATYQDRLSRGTATRVDRERAYESSDIVDDLLLEAGKAQLGWAGDRLTSLQGEQRDGAVRMNVLRSQLDYSLNRDEAAKVNGFVTSFQAAMDIPLGRVATGGIMREGRQAAASTSQVAWEKVQETFVAGFAGGSPNRTNAMLYSAVVQLGIPEAVITTRLLQGGTEDPTRSQASEIMTRMTEGRGNAQDQLALEADSIVERQEEMTRLYPSLSGAAKQIVDARARTMLVRAGVLESLEAGEEVDPVLLRSLNLTQEEVSAPDFFSREPQKSIGELFNALAQGDPSVADVRRGIMESEAFQTWEGYVPAAPDASFQAFLRAGRGRRREGARQVRALEAARVLSGEQPATGAQRLRATLTSIRDPQAVHGGRYGEAAPEGERLASRISTEGLPEALDPSEIQDVMETAEGASGTEEFEAAEAGEEAGVSPEAAEAGEDLEGQEAFEQEFMQFAERLLAEEAGGSGEVDLLGSPDLPPIRGRGEEREEEEAAREAALQEQAPTPPPEEEEREPGDLRPTEGLLGFEERAFEHGPPAGAAPGGGWDIPSERKESPAAWTARSEAGIPADKGPYGQGGRSWLRPVDDPEEEARRRATWERRTEEGTGFPGRQARERQAILETLDPGPSPGRREEVSEERREFGRAPEEEAPEEEAPKEGEPAAEEEQWKLPEEKRVKEGPDDTQRASQFAAALRQSIGAEPEVDPGEIAAEAETVGAPSPELEGVRGRIQGRAEQARIAAEGLRNVQGLLGTPGGGTSATLQSPATLGTAAYNKPPEEPFPKPRGKR